MIKIAVIGAGSIGFTRRLFRDILAVPELEDTCFAFTDISKRNLDMVTELCRKDLKNNPQITKKAKLTSSLNRIKAFENADYVLNLTRIGGIEAFKHDIEIPLKYGIDQCVGDTLCAGGIMYAQRNIPQILQWCSEIRKYAKPNVLMINYSNPMAMNTWAVLDYGGVNVIGLCHGVEHGWQQISDVLGAKCQDINGTCIGINHQTWYTKILHKGKEVSSDKLLKAFESHKEYSKTEKCRIDVLKRFGFYSTESNGHLSEYLPWYRKRPDEIKHWISMDSWIHGETGGYLRICSEGRNWFETDFPKWMKAEDMPMGPQDRSDERASYIIEALETGKLIRTYANVRNNNCITNLPSDCIVEVPVYIDKNGISVPQAGDLPLACAATCIASINVQRMAKEAAVKGDITQLKQAMMHDPLIESVCNLNEIWQMTDEMLVAQAKWLPQYKYEIPRAAQRLKTPVVNLKKRYKGVRIKTKSVDELRQNFGGNFVMDAGDRDKIKTN